MERYAIDIVSASKAHKIALITKSESQINHIKTEWVTLHYKKRPKREIRKLFERINNDQEWEYKNDG